MQMYYDCNVLYDMTWQQKVGIAEQVRAVVARQRHGKHVSAAADTETATEDMVFCAVISR